ncbi:hypothetical protein LCGC14_1449470 [marine sediment metagenome]|uniref:Uncharacterized protein n=1 Tax=marine sediment metagenome TaxID=412755 RepID=A0A0F9JJ02_9ZZZZ
MEDYPRILINRFLGLYDKNLDYIKEIHKISDENEIQSIGDLEKILRALISDEKIGLQFETALTTSRDKLMIYLLKNAGIIFAFTSDEFDALERQGRDD